MSTDHENYVFNCGEGMQRLACEYSIKLSKLSHIFVTKPSWSNIGGLLGVLLTVKSIGVSKVNIHCLSKIQEYIEEVKHFASLDDMNISYAPINELEPYKDKVVTIQYVPIRKALKNSYENNPDSSNETNYCSNKNGKRVIDVKKVDDHPETEAKKLKVDSDLMCFICEVKPKPGKLLTDKLIKLGIRPGPIYGLLKKGIDITTEKGIVVFSKDVCMPDSSKINFMVVECPSDDYLDSLVNHSAFSKYQITSSTENKEGIVHCIFHITPEEIFSTPQYQDWITKFPPNTQHIVLNSKNSGISSRAVHKNQYLLNMLHPEIFPLLHEEECLKNNYYAQNIHRGKVMQTLKIRPFRKHIDLLPDDTNPKSYVKEVTEIVNFTQTLETLKSNINALTEKYNLKNTPEYPCIVMLGTGSSIPNKIRNTSGILLRIDKDSSILMDCGEGTIGQMTKFYGNSELDNVLRSIQAIYISHMHTDHHIGLIGVLQRRKKCTDEKLFLIGPHELEQWLNFYDLNYEPISNLYTFVSNYDLYLHNHKITKSFETVLCTLLNIKDINTVFVRHCKHSYGIAIILKDDKKIVYSGDTMPSENLINLGKDCDLLIHEATMEDGLKELATQKLHSTVSDAIKVGQLMNAKFNLLTHFSQRYAKIPIWSEEEKNVGLAYDNMQIKLSQLPLLHLFYPCLKLIYKESFKIISDSATTSILAV
ncbi:ribonuclease Z isoform X2 [Calliopsis andreniformis]